MAENDAFRVKKRINLKTNTTAGEDPGDIRYDGSGNLQLRDGSSEKTVLDQDNSVTVTNKTIDADNNTVSNIGDDEIVAGVNAEKIADGSVTNTEFQYINTLTSNAQDQIDAKAAASDLTDHLNDTTDAHDASAISNTPSGNLAATDVQGAVDELQGDIDTVNAALPAGSIVGTTDTQDLSNKTFTDAITLEEKASTPANPSAGDKKLYAKDDGKLYTLDSAGNEIEVGSGAGGGGIFYINEDFEAGVDSLVAYADTAGTSPVDGTGGTPAGVSVAAETTNPLIGDTSARISKDAANRQGEGVAIVSATVDEAYSDKVHTVELLFKSDANYASGDLSLWVVHPTTGTVEALNFRTALGEYTNEIPASSSTVTRIVSELTPIDDTYRIVLHVGSTSATAWAVDVDDIKAGPQRTFNAPIVTEWESYTPIISAGFGTTTGVNAQYRRVGSNIEVNAVFTAGTVAASQAEFYLPSGLNFDPNFRTTGDLRHIGVWYRNSSTGTETKSGVLAIDENSDNFVYFALRDYDVTVSPFSGQNVNFFVANNDDITLSFVAPIQGWDAGAAFSTTQVDQQTPGARLSGEPTSSLGAGSKAVITWKQTDFDNSNSITDLERFTAKTKGFYQVNAKFSYSYTGAAGVTDDIGIYIDKNDVEYSRVIDRTNSTTTNQIRTIQISDVVELNAGDYIEIKSIETSSGTVAFQGNDNNHWFSVVKLPDFTVFGTFPEKNLVQTKFLNADVSGVVTNSVLSDLTFSNLTVGKWYEVVFHSTCKVAVAGTEVKIDVLHDSSVITRAILINDTSTQNIIDATHVAKFKATANTVTFSATSSNAGDNIFGSGNLLETWAQLEERNDLRETSKF